MNKNKAVKAEIIEEKICKKCGEPIPSTSKYKKCDNCRRKSAEQKKRILEGAAAVCTLALMVVPGVNKFVKKK